MMSKNNLSFGKIVYFLVGGILVGIANGMFGGGGGMLCVPMLLLAGMQNKKAQATAILIMTPISIASVIVYYTSGYIDLLDAMYVGIGSIVGGLLGANLLKKFSNDTLQYIFAFIMLIAGIRLVW